MSDDPDATRSVIVCHAAFHRIWPWAALAMRREWERDGPVEFVTQEPDDDREAHRLVRDPETVRRLIVLVTPFGEESVVAFSGLAEAAILAEWGEQPAADLLRARGLTVHQHESEGFWGQSVAEFGLALTLCGLRRIPQTYQQMQADLSIWDYRPEGSGVPRAGGRGEQFGDDPRFTHGTVAGKRVRVVGAGNIGSRYADFAAMLGADVAVWDPYASEPAFYRSGARREHYLRRLIADAEIFAPMLPLSQSTRGLVTAAEIDALPLGCLVVLVTRAGICDMAAIRRRVLADEIALAADVWDVEPLALDDPLLGRHNVVHTPHNAGRTRDANVAFARALTDRFVPPIG